ncbi:hypothetical protein [Rhodoferax sp.]|uniref:substrate-binding periplasmic protein n=1 Tax=Rhodoferax sp. TaxID=50421 RepID=UPI0025E33743|nr:hypothetical protein [Rhodoferax sp.]
MSVVLRQAYATQGHAVDIKVLPWRRAIKMAMEGSVAGPLGFYSASQLECAEAQGVLSDAIGSFQFGLAQRTGGLPPWRDWTDLHGRRIGIVEGYDNGPDITRLLEHGLLIPDQAPSDLFSLKKLEANRVDYVSIDQQVFEYLTRKHQLNGLQMAPRYTMPRLPLFVCFNRTARADAMRAVLNSGLKRVNVRKIAQDYLRSSSP